MKRMFFILLMLIFAAPPVLWAGGRNADWDHRSGIRRSIHAPARESWSRHRRTAGRPLRNFRRRRPSPVRLRRRPEFSERHRRLTRRHEEYRRARRRHHGYWWPGRTVLVDEEQPIVIVNIPAPPEPPPAIEPQAVWVPAVMGTRTEAGYWDYAIKKVWKGDHWLFEQDFEKPRWVPPTTVEYVKQEGYWKIVE